MSKKQASEAGISGYTSPSEVDKLTLDEYLGVTQVNPGLVVSYRYEARKTASMLDARTAEEWDTAFDIQSKTVYL